MADFPTTPEALDADRLTRYLRRSGHLTDGEVSSFEHRVIGTGKMGDNARITLTYAGDRGQAPATLVGKFPATEEATREAAGAGGAYYNEVMFYRELAPHTTMRIPTIYASELSEDRTEFLLLMEDMAPAEPGNNLEGASRAQAELALPQAARLAAAFYGNEGTAEHDFVMTAARDDGGEFGAVLMEQFWPGFVDRYGHGMSREMIAFGERYVRNHRHFVTRFDGPRTLAHGDFRSENILYGDGVATTVDWQTPGESSALTDASYFLGGSVTPEERREWERDLIAQYRVELDREGAALSEQDCWDQYREFAMHGIIIIVLGASFSTPDERSDRMFLTLIQRHLTHCMDVDAGEFLPA
ncbi:MAG: phosphotransferase [Halioglobus sp.]|nr:phosphotransferase [Halioglobus sp.]